MTTKLKLIFVLLTAIMVFGISRMDAADWSWKHEDTSNTTEYVLYKVVGDIDDITIKGDGDDLPVGRTPVGSLIMENVVIEPNSTYYLRAENDIFVSGRSNNVVIPGLPKGIIELKLTLNLTIQ